MQVMLLKKLLKIAAVLGVVQGILTFIGGIIACFDKSSDVLFLALYRKMIVDGLPEIMRFARNFQIFVLQAMILFNLF